MRPQSLPRRSVSCEFPAGGQVSPGASVAGGVYLQPEVSEDGVLVVVSLPFTGLRISAPAVHSGRAGQRPCEPQYCRRAQASRPSL
ncbi:hypothetical protein AOLI_G00330990 [Acnodon oligacanthus]